jgi:hypothetical protein
MQETINSGWENNVKIDIPGNVEWLPLNLSPLESNGDKTVGFINGEESPYLWINCPAFNIWL